MSFKLNDFDIRVKGNHSSQPNCDGLNHTGYGCIVDFVTYDTPTAIFFLILTNSAGKKFARGVWLDVDIILRKTGERADNTRIVTAVMDAKWNTLPPFDLESIKGVYGYVYSELSENTFARYLDDIMEGRSEATVMKSYAGYGASPYTFVVPDGFVHDD